MHLCNDMFSLTKEALQVRNILLLHGLENPINKLNNIDSRVRIRQISEHITAIMTLLNLNLEHDSLLLTPHRIASMYVKEIFLGLDYLNFPKITVIKNTMKIDKMIIVRNINIISICEHHFVIFYGKATISYIPNKNVIGLSTINKVAYFFSKRPQLQERLTQQIFLALQTLLDTNDVAIFINAVHYCVKIRGIHDVSSTVSTMEFGGLFKFDESIRRDFLNTVTYCSI